MNVEYISFRIQRSAYPSLPATSAAIETIPVYPTKWYTFFIFCWLWAATATPEHRVQAKIYKYKNKSSNSISYSFYTFSVAKTHSQPSTTATRGDARFDRRFPIVLFACYLCTFHISILSMGIIYCIVRHIRTDILAGTACSTYPISDKPAIIHCQLST